MTQKKQYTIKIIAISFLVLALVVIGLCCYNNRLTQRLAGSVEITMSELAESQQHSVNMEFSSQISDIETIAQVLQSRPASSAEDDALLTQLAAKTNFDYMVIRDTDGHLLSQTGEAVALAQQSYFQHALQGETSLSEPLTSPINGQRIVALATPITQAGTVTSILTGVYTFEQMNNLLATSFGDRGYAFILNRQGDMIAQTANYDLTDHLSGFEIWDQSTFHAHYTAKDLVSDMQTGQSGHSDYTFGDVRRLIEYRPLQYNGWMLVIVVPQQVAIGNEASAISQDTTILMLAIIFCVALVVWYLLLQRYRQDKERKEHVEQLEQLAYYDSLTHLPNLYKFKMLAREVLSDRPRDNFVLTKIDILNFKLINDIFGFEVGDKILLAMAEILRETIAPPSSGENLQTLARVGADEFLFFDTECQTEDSLREAIHLFEEVTLQTVRFLLGNHKLSFRYGVYVMQAGEDSIDEAIECANLAHRMAKEHKHEEICYYDTSIRERVLQEAHIESKMEASLHNGEFQVYLQPKYALKSESIVGAEALVRWIDPDGTLTMPIDFIPLFERNGFIVQLDLHIFRSVCALIGEWIAADITPITVSVNFSRLHLNNQDLVAELTAITKEYDIPKKYIEIELTETVIFENEEAMTQLLEKLHVEGFTLSMDDFGTGYSSLGLLKNLPVDVIKIDRSFIYGSKQEKRARAVLQSVVDMAKSLDIYSVAEGVETTEQVQLLREIGCDMVQGFYFAKPMPTQDFTLLLIEKQLREGSAQLPRSHAYNGGVPSSNPV